MPAPAQGDAERLGNKTSEINEDAGDADVDDRGDNLGCGITFIIIGVGMLAQNMGWLPKGDWFWPAVLIGLGIGSLFKAFTRK